jgi:hypothetical protein
VAVDSLEGSGHSLPWAKKCLPFKTFSVTSRTGNLRQALAAVAKNGTRIVRRAGESQMIPANFPAGRETSPSTP